MSKKSIFKIAHIKIITFILIFPLFLLLLSPNTNFGFINAQQITPIVSAYSEKVVFYKNKNIDLPKIPQPKTPKEIQAEQKAKEDKARLAAQKAAEQAAAAAERAAADAEKARKAAEAEKLTAFADKGNKIEAYLKSKSSPLAGNGAKLAELETKYGVPAKMVIAIAGVESSFCRVNFRPYNCWGWGSKSFSSYPVALEAFFSYIKTEYFNKGLTTPELMNSKYAESKAWAGNVKKYMNQMNF